MWQTVPVFNLTAVFLYEQATYRAQTAASLRWDKRHLFFVWFYIFHACSLLPADFLLVLLRLIDVRADLNSPPPPGRSRRRDRRLWHLRVCLHPRENGVGAGRVCVRQPDLQAQGGV